MGFRACRLWGAMAALCIASAAATLSDKAQAAGGAYQVDTAEVSGPGSCKVEVLGFAREQPRFFRRGHAVLRRESLPRGRGERADQPLARRRRMGYRRYAEAQDQLDPEQRRLLGPRDHRIRRLRRDHPRFRRVQRHASGDVPRVERGAAQPQRRLPARPFGPTATISPMARVSTGARPTMSGR